MSTEPYRDAVSEYLELGQIGEATYCAGHVARARAVVLLVMIIVLDNEPGGWQNPRSANRIFLNRCQRGS